MELEKQVVSLDLAKRLKELGVKQESLFYWSQLKNDWYVTQRYEEDNFSAFTVAELGEMLPEFVMTMKRVEDFVCTDYMNYRKEEFGRHEATTEADARAKMLIYLLENKLI